MDEMMLNRVANWFNVIMTIFDFEATVENGKIKVVDLEFPDDEDRINYFDSVICLLDAYADLLFENAILAGDTLEEIEKGFWNDLTNMKPEDLGTDEPLICASNLSKIVELRTIVDYKEYWEVA